MRREPAVYWTKAALHAYLMLDLDRCFCIFYEKMSATVRKPFVHRSDTVDVEMTVA
ncbi:hypothetical protein BS78_K330300 [Paspalum vaginatum]|uniref:Uncharacterized protein n=1 Tax=Paspalum vaginatum TaxID=158149 RepID=A0A9W7XD10_9POAL|nr:hypothetical protein BS78_K330300 [Paspalum vaginatum]